MNFDSPKNCSPISIPSSSAREQSPNARNLRDCRRRLFTTSHPCCSRSMPLVIYVLRFLSSIIRGCMFTHHICVCAFNFSPDWVVVLWVLPFLASVSASFCKGLDKNEYMNHDRVDARVQTQHNKNHPRPGYAW